MINEFLKSISRTLGRIFAYVLIAFIIYFIASTFKVKAATINTNYFQIQSITQNWGVGQQSYSNYLIDYLNFTFGYQFTPVYTNQNNIPLLASDYEIYANYDIVINDIWPFIPTYQFQVYNNGWVNATCDGQVEDNMITQTVQGTWTRYNFEYKCSLLNVNQDFTAVRFRVFDTQISNPRSTVEFQINSFNILDKNEISTGDQAIINNNNQNTQTIINNNNENTTIISGKLEDTKDSVDELKDAMTSEQDANLSILNGLENYKPSDTPVTDIITLPLTILNAEINALGQTCSPISIPTGSLLGNHTITFPCINLERRLGASSGYTFGDYSLWQIIDLMFCLIMGYNILMLIISAYNKFTNLEDPYRELYVSPAEARWSYYHRSSD